MPSIHVIRFIILFVFLAVLSYQDIHTGTVLIAGPVGMLLLAAIEVVMVRRMAASELMGVFGVIILLEIIRRLSGSAFGSGDAAVIAVVLLWEGLQDGIAAWLLGMVLLVAVGSVKTIVGGTSMKQKIPFIPYLTVGLFLIHIAALPMSAYEADTDQPRDGYTLIGSISMGEGSDKEAVLQLEGYVCRSKMSDVYDFTIDLKPKVGEISFEVGSVKGCLDEEGIRLEEGKRIMDSRMFSLLHACLSGEGRFMEGKVEGSSMEFAGYAYLDNSVARIYSGEFPTDGDSAHVNVQLFYSGKELERITAFGKVTENMQFDLKMDANR